MPTQPVDRLRAICSVLPEVTERPSHGAPTWFVRGRRAFVTLWEHGHHDRHFPHLWLAGQPGTQEELIAIDPARYFRPAYVGGRGWVGVRLDDRICWDEIAELCVDAYRSVAPRTLTTRLDSTRLETTQLETTQLDSTRLGTAQPDGEGQRREGAAGPLRGLIIEW